MITPRPDQSRHTAKPSTPFTQMVLYDGRDAELISGRAYERTREAIAERGSDLSVFRLDKDDRWCVTVFGETPPAAELGEEISRHLADGRPFELPKRVTRELFAFHRRILGSLERWEGRYGR